NLEWVQPGSDLHKLFPATGDISDSVGHVLVTAYAVLRPDGQWALMLVNKDQENPQGLRIVFHDESSNSDSSFSGSVDTVTFGSEQYRWHPMPGGGTADPDGPAIRSTIITDAETTYTLPKASVSIIRGRIAPLASRK